MKKGAKSKTAMKGKKATGSNKPKPNGKKADQGGKGQTKKGTLKPAKVFIYALALAALGGGSYLVYEKIKSGRANNDNESDSDSSFNSNSNSNSGSNSNPNSSTVNVSTPSASVSSSPGLISSYKKLTSGNENFPLKKGSKGAKVKQLQQALAKTVSSLTVDGNFGTQTVKALRTAGYAQVVDEPLFNRITGTNSEAIKIVFNPSSLAVNLYKAAQNKNAEQVLSLLQQLNSVSDYSSVNDYYKRQSFISKTIVTDLLEYAFSNDAVVKEKIKNEFTRMGLKVSATGTWSLQGIRLFKDLITIRETVVIDTRNNRIPVKRNTILGDEVQVANGMTWFRSIDHTLLQVPTQDVRFT